MEQEPIYMLEMEEALAKDSEGSYKSEILKELTEYSTKVKQMMDTGLAPDDFQTAQKVSDAIESAVKVVEQTWEAVHPK